MKRGLLLLWTHPAASSPRRALASLPTAPRRVLEQLAVPELDLPKEACGELLRVAWRDQAAGDGGSFSYLDEAKRLLGTVQSFIWRKVFDDAPPASQQSEQPQPDRAAPARGVAALSAMPMRRAQAAGLLR